MVSQSRSCSANIEWKVVTKADYETNGVAATAAANFLFVAGANDAETTLKIYDD